MILEFLSLKSVLVSLLIINGLFNLANILSPVLKKTFLPIKDQYLLKIINFFLLTNCLALITFILSLYFEINKDFIIFISIILILVGLYKPFYLFKIFQIQKKKNLEFYIIYLILLFYFILSISPATDPDSLDYHITVPLYQINFQDIPIMKYWMASQLSGAGETLLLYSIVLGSINLSQILQFISLLILITFILNFQDKTHSLIERKKLFVVLCILTMPVLLFLIGSSKPQMFPLVTNFFCLILTTFYLPKLNHQYTVKCFCLIIFLLSCSTQFKFSFLLSSSLISILAMFEMYKKKQFTKSIFFASLIGLLVILPRELFEFINLNHNIIYNFLNPITDNYSSTNFNISLKHGVGNSALLPIWIFLPYPNISEFTYTLGPAVLYFIFEMKLKYNINKKILIISFLFILIALLFSQAVGRFFIEPFIWLLFFSLFYTKKKQDNIMKFFEKVLIIGSIIFVIFLGYFSLNLFKGNLNNELFNKVLEKNADGYLLFKWANEVIPDNSVIISTHRSISFYKHKAIPYEFRLYTSTERIDSFNYYMSEILKEKPMFILYSGSEFNNKTDILKNCRGDLYKFKKNVGYTAGRSPFFKKNKYDGYIFYLDPKKIKKCKL